MLRFVLPSREHSTAAEATRMGPIKMLDKDPCALGSPQGRRTFGVEAPAFLYECIEFSSHT